MQNPGRKLYIWTRFLADESGQDLLEYVLLFALIALGVVAGMGAIAGDLNNAFNSISSTFGLYTN